MEKFFIAIIPIITKTCIDLQIRRLYLHESNKLFGKKFKGQSYPCRHAIYIKF